jgi:hypothetical protein
VFLMLAWRSGVGQGQTADWFNWAGKASWIMMALRDRWQTFDFASIVVALIVIVEARRRSDLAFSRNLAFSVLILIAGYVILPRIVFGSAYADMRLAPFMIALALLAIRFRGETDLRSARTIVILGLSFYAIRIASTTISLAMAANSQAAKLEALEHVPRGAKLVNLAAQECDNLWSLPRNSHLGSMAIVRRHAFSNDQWALEGANLLTVHYAPAGHFMSDSSQMVRPARCAHRDAKPIARALAEIPRDAFDYLWTIDLPPQPPGVPAGFVPIWRGQGSVLYVNQRLAKGSISARKRQ